MASPDPARPPQDAPSAGPQRKTAAPLLWILLLLALLVFGWLIYSQRSGVTPAPEPPPPAVGIGDAREAAAERERAADAAREAREAGQARDGGERPRPPAPAMVGGPDRDATPLTRIEPEYPVDAYRNREEGTVLVAASLDAGGRPTRVDLVRRSGSRALDQAALDAVGRWTFEPAVRDGRAVASEVQVPVTFRIDR